MAPREKQGGGGFLLGTLIGVVTGIVGGLALLRQGRATETRVEFREEIVAENGGAEEVVGAAAVRTTVPPGPVERLRALAEVIQARWNAAVAEGRLAAAERERELQAQLAAETKRIPEIEAELLDAARERAPEAVREFERLTQSDDR